MKWVIAFIGLLMGVPVAALSQSDSLYIPSMQEVYQQNSWLYGANPVGLSFNRFRAFSMVEVGSGYSAGNLGNTSIPSSSSVYFVRSEAFQRLGKIALYGQLEYGQNVNRGQNWNGMVNDYWQAVQLCDSVSGKRRSEAYHLSAAFSMPIKSHWILGAQADYRVEMVAKDTDPRNKNQWSEWMFASGIGYHKGNNKLGVSLLYANRKESIDFQNMGTHAVYPFFAGYPLSFFQTLPKDENLKWYYTGYEFGGALQSEMGLDEFRWFQQFAGSISKQNIESSRIRDRKEGESELWQVNYLGKIQRSFRHSRHEWSLRIWYGQSDNYDPLQQQEESGVWKSYGRVLRSTRCMGSGDLSYEYRRMRDIWNPYFTVLSGVSYNYQENALLFYPTKYLQPLHRFSVYTTFMRSIVLPDAFLDCSLGGRYGVGGGTIMKEEKLTTDSNTSEIKLWQNISRLQQDYDYETAARFALNFSVTYTRKTPFRWFVRLSGGYEYLHNCQPKENNKKFITQIGLIF